MNLDNILTEKRIIITLAVVGLFAALFLLPLRFLAVYAQTLTSPAPEETPAPMVIDADDAGNVVMRGQVTSVEDNSMTISSWGGEWTIRTTMSSAVTPATEVAGNLSAISNGDFVGVEGVFATDEEMTVDASFVRDWTTDPLPGVFEVDTIVDTTGTVSVSTGTEEVEDGEVEEVVPDMITYSGEVDRVDDTSFTFTDDFGSVYTVTVDNEVAVVNDNSEVRELEDVDIGDSVELDGVANGTVITTAMVRITSE
ncbi:hypothetical protein A2837_00150 [Candidatus Kaiserbacteria bacterium RIFCSPHIGHO2_01_FULL_46_22]|uniref:DUF5666 domain-containing protein n=1 Tax=Candidatus Kaiserbacteria bacterium RIFCSPHIGHO2_01_FULL_46_22 TaxID=1798475 RepID=A0A1F6BXV6_9BACT|nr:MAG: hypothetical protein A2837_00150 [Candidatus Kaiserbacteria bacterium RIFCSPHIGHO2_01_FULL_46_22]